MKMASQLHLKQVGPLMLGLSLDFIDNELYSAQLFLFSEKIQLINLSVHYLWKSKLVAPDMLLSI